MHWKNISIPLLAVSASLPAAADEFRCDRKQTRCSVENVRLTIGDEVGILNEDSELVATAEVDGIQGRRRQLNVKRRHGRIFNGYKLTRLTPETGISELESSYKVFKPSSDALVSATAEIASLGVGEGVFSYAAHGYYEAKIKQYLYWTGRGFFLTGSGNIRPYSGGGVSVISASSFGAMGGLAYKTKRRGDLVFRTEAALGFGYIMSDIDGDAGLVDLQVDQMNNGFGLASRLEVQAIYQGNDWSPALVGSYGFIQSASIGSVGIGLSKALD